MQKIRVNPDEMKSSAESLKDCAMTFNDTYLKQMDEIVTDINGGWQGEDATQYVDVMRENYMIEFKELSIVFQQYGEFLDKAAESYVTLDGDFASRSIDV